MHNYGLDSSEFDELTDLIEKRREREWTDRELGKMLVLQMKHFERMLETIKVFRKKAASGSVTDKERTFLKTTESMASMWGATFKIDDAKDKTGTEILEECLSLHEAGWDFIDDFLKQSIHGFVQSIDALVGEPIVSNWSNEEIDKEIESVTILLDKWKKAPVGERSMETLYELLGKTDRFRSKVRKHQQVERGRRLVKALVKYTEATKELREKKLGSLKKIIAILEKYPEEGDTTPKHEDKKKKPFRWLEGILGWGEQERKPPK